MPTSKRSPHFTRLIFIACLVIAILFVQSCDPGKVLTLKSSGKPGVSVTLYSSRKFFQYRLKGGESDSDKIIITIPTNEARVKRDTSFMYGLGFWDNKATSEVASGIDSIVILNSNGSIILDHQKDIEDYLLQQRHGYLHSHITIEAK